MAMARLARNGAQHSSIKQLPLAYSSLSRFSSSIFNSTNTCKSSSTSPIFNQSFDNNNFTKRTFSNSSPYHISIARNYSSGRHFDPYERYVRRTAVNFGIKFVPQQEAYVVERFGKFSKVLEAGLHFLIPFVDRIAYIHSLKEQTFEVPEQPAVTTDNVSIMVNGVLFVKVVDAEKASYGNDNVMFAVTQLAQTVMRSAIGKMPLDRTFMERDTLNANIVEAINEVASQWGIFCRRYEIRDIIPPRGIRESMEMQAEAERKKRATVIEAEGKREAVILTSDAAKMDSINRAKGEAEAIRVNAIAEAEAIRAVANALEQHGGQAAASLKVAQDYVQAFNKMAKESTTLLIPSSASDASGMVTSALMLYRNLIFDTHNKKNAAPSSKELTDHPSHDVDNDAFKKHSVANEDEVEARVEDDGEVPVHSPVFILSKKIE